MQQRTLLTRHSTICGILVSSTFISANIAYNTASYNIAPVSSLQAKAQPSSTGYAKTTKIVPSTSLGSNALSNSNSAQKWYKAIIKPEEFIRLGKPIVQSGSNIFKYGRTQITVNKALRGRLTFSTFDFKTQRSSLIVLDILEGKPDQESGVGKILDSSISLFKAIIFPIEKIGRVASAPDYGVYSPQLSPNGNVILFQFGNSGDTFPIHWLYTLDISKAKLERVSDTGFANPSVSWSSDGRYIYFLSGGDGTGRTNVAIANQVIETAPIELHACDLQKRLECRITNLENTSMPNSGPYKWIAPHTVIYSDLKLLQKAPISPAASQSQSLAKSNAQVVRPSIYEWSAGDQKLSQTIKDGFLPTPSLDSSSIAFFGSEDPAKPRLLPPNWQQRANGMALLIARRDGSDRTALDNLQEYYPALMWSPDNRHLLTLQRIQGSPNSKAELKEWDVKEKTFRSITVVEATDFRKFSFIDEPPTFTLLSLTSDAQSLWLSIDEITGKDPNAPVFNEVKSLKLVDLKTGIVTPVVTLKNAGNIDWYSQH